MANSKISALPSATTPLAGTEVLPIVQSSATDQVTVANLTAGRAVSALSITTTNDASINGQTLGKGGSNISSNTTHGNNALNSNTTGSNNTSMGQQALNSNTTGSNNTAVGQQSSIFNTTGNNNVSYGIASLYQNTTGGNNTGIGRYALFGVTTTVGTLGAITGGTGYNGGASGGPFTVQSSLSSGTPAGTYPTLSITVTSGVITGATLVTFGTKFQDTTTVLTVTSAAMVSAGFAAGGSGFSIPVATLLTPNNNTGIGYSSGLGLTSGSNNVILGSYQGIFAPILVTGSSYVVLSDGAGNVRGYFDSSNNFFASGPILSNSVAVPTISSTSTLTNKWIQPRVLASTANSATPTLNTDNYDMMVITGQSVAITSFSTNLTGTPVNGQKLIIAITGTASIAITWGASFESSTTTLPSTTSGTNRLDIGFVWNVATSKWRCLAVA